MKKNFKKALLAAPVACLALSLGAFAAACTPHEHAYEWGHDFDQHWQVCPDCPEPEEPQKVDHDFKGTANCECGAKRGKIDAIVPGLNEITADGVTAVAFVVSSCGTYSLTVSDLGDKSYTFTVNGTDYTVNKTNPKFIFNVEAGSKVEVFNPDGLTTSSGTGSDNPNERDGEQKKTLSEMRLGVRIKITPAADYSNGEVKDVVKFNIGSLSQMLKTGNNAGDDEIDVSQPIIHTYANGSTYGEYTFDFDINDDVSEYTVEIAGQTKTVNKANSSFKVNLQSGDGAEQQKGNGMYAIKFTPKAGSAQTVGCYIVQPEQSGSFDFGDTAGVNVNYSKEPEIFDYYNREYEFKVKNAKDTDGNYYIVAGNEYAFAGMAYYSNFELYMGSTKVGEVTDVNTENEEAKDFVIKFTINAADLVENEVSFKIVFTGATTNYAVLGGVVNVPEEVDNTILELYDSVFGTNLKYCNASDESEGKFIYKFTAPEAGWYKFGVTGNPKVQYKLGDSITGNASPMNSSETIELAKGQLITLELIGYAGDGTEGSAVSPVGTQMTVETTTESVDPGAVDATNELVVGKIKIDFTDCASSMDGIILSFTSNEGGTYRLSIVSPAANGQEVAFGVGKNGEVDYFSEPVLGEGMIYHSTHTFTLKAGESISFAFADNWGEDNSFIVQLEKV